MAYSPYSLKTKASHERLRTTVQHLHHAAWKGHAEIAQLLIEAGADVNAQNENTHYGGTPLHAAAHGNQKAVVELLIGAGADVKAISGNGRTPLQESEIHNATAAAKLLKAAGA